MIPNAFVGRANHPSEAEVAAELGPAKKHWDRLIAALAGECDVQEWNSYSPKAGWALRLKRGSRAIVYLSPSHGCFLASFALGDKAVAAARKCGLPAPVLKIIDEARRYAEGTAVRIEVHAARDVAAVQKLAAVKLAN